MEGQILKKRLKNVLMMNKINPKDITPSLVGDGSSWKLETELSRMSPDTLPKNVSVRIISFLVDQNATFSSEYLYGLSDDYGESPKIESEKKVPKKKKYAKAVEAQYRSLDGRAVRSDIDVDMVENNCNKAFINPRFKELGLKKSFINYWFSKTNAGQIYNIIDKHVKSINKNEQKLLAYFLQGSVSSLTIGFSKTKEDHIESFTPSKLSIFYLNPDEAGALNDDEINLFIKKIGINMTIYNDMINQICLIPELAALEMLEVYNKITNQELKFDDLFIRNSKSSKKEELVESKPTQHKHSYPDNFSSYYTKYIEGKMTTAEIAKEIGVHITTVYKYMDEVDEVRKSMGFEPMGRKKKNRTGKAPAAKKTETTKTEYKGGYKKPEYCRTESGEVIEYHDDSSMLESVMISAELTPSANAKAEYSTMLNKRLISLILDNANNLTSDELFALADYLKSMGIQKLNEEKVRKLLDKKSK